jgi:site-specific recombinase XerD
MADYEAAMAGQPLPVGVKRARPGTMWALALSYFASPEFRGLRQSTQRAYRGTIERVCREHGDKRAADLRREHVVRLMTARAGEPGAANALRVVLRVMMKHAVEIGLRADDPTREVKPVRIKSDGHHSWTDDEIAQFERHHPIRSRARLALALLLVTTRQGGPFQGSAFSRWFRQQCDRAGLPHCSAHGLRKAAARRLAEAGCTAHEIGAITGHASLSELVRYTRAADQKRLAETAMTKTRTSSGKPR